MRFEERLVFRVLRFLELFFIFTVEIFGHVFDEVLVYDSFIDQLVSLNHVDRLFLSDYAVHYWLCELWFIYFVVSILTLTDQVNDDIFLKLLSVLDGCLENEIDVFQVFCVNVEDRGFNCFGKI